MRSHLAVWSLALVLAALAPATQAFYIPGVSPRSYANQEQVVVKVNSLTSNQGVMPFSFYHFKQCQPDKARIKAERKRENLGELLWGDQIEPSEFEFYMKKNITCKTLCEPLSYTQKEMKVLEKLIEQQYRGNLIMDNLPVAQHTHAGPRFPKVLIGYPLGVPSKLVPEKKTVINNHLVFQVHYYEGMDQNDDYQDTYRIVGFYAAAHSVEHKPGDCGEGKPFNPATKPTLTTQATEVTWSYSIQWIEDEELPWATRWDVYLKGGEHDDKIHWLAIINSLLVLLCLTGMVAMIMLRVLHRDFNRYNNPENPDEAQEEVGWKNVHGDVFRAPGGGYMLAALVGAGSQVQAMAAVTLVFACLGFLSPSNRGGLLTTTILIFVLLGSYAGYIAARLLKFFDQQNWRNIFLTGLLVPGLVFGVYFFLNLVQWAKHASSAVRFTTLLLLMALWFFVSLPLVLVGASVGYRREKLKMPVKTNPVPRLIPVQKWYLEGWVVILSSGVLPFGACFIELVYILSSFWQGRVYYVFGFLALVFLILMVTCAEVTVVMIYFQLCYENYNWWWRSFWLSASAGLHMYLYSLYYLVAVLSIRQPTSVVLYLGYMGLAALLFGLVTGTMGFHSAFFFVRRIYGAIKIE